MHLDLEWASAFSIGNIRRKLGVTIIVRIFGLLWPCNVIQ